MLELVVVIVMIAILSAVAVPSISAMLTNMNLSGEARNLMAVLQKARLVAAKENNFVVVTFDPDNDGVLDCRYMMFVDEGGVANQYDEGEKILLNGGLARGIEMTEAAFKAAPSVKYVCFNRRGYPLDADGTPFSGHVKIKNSENRTKTIALGLAGNVTITN